MSNDELTWIAATRLHTLTEEARLALEEAIRLRKLDGFEAEVAAVKDDLAQQRAAEQIEAKKRNGSGSWALRLFRWFLSLFLSGVN
jgi:hypothetical protein